MDNNLDLESWQQEYWIFKEKRRDELVALRKKEAEGTSLGDGLYEEVADALVLAQRFDEAIKLLFELHKINPKQKSIHNLILQVLKETNKSETDFNWLVKPKIIRLDEDLFQFCISVLKNKRKKNRTFNLIRKALIVQNAHMDFDIEELKEWLKMDERLKFVNGKDKDYPYIEII